MQVFSKDSNLPDAALGDSDCVELCAAVEQVACMGCHWWKRMKTAVLNHVGFAHGLHFGQALLEWNLTGPTRQCEGDWTRTTSTL